MARNRIIIDSLLSPPAIDPDQPEWLDMAALVALADPHSIPIWPTSTMPVRFCDVRAAGRPRFDADGCAMTALVAAYPIWMIERLAFGWRGGFRKEGAIWAEDGQPHRHDELTEDPMREPIVLLERGGRAWPWDGFHRTGASVTVGRTRIPAIVGHLKTPEAFRAA